MPPSNSQRRQLPSRMARNTSSAPSNPPKRRKIEASQSSNRADKIDEIDLRVGTNRGSKPCFGCTNWGLSPRFVIFTLQLASKRICCMKRGRLTSSQDVDDDAGLSKVLEQQRMATIKAQQEQANKPVKLSTLQCIICMENMKDLTATHCGSLVLFPVFLATAKFFHFPRSPILSCMSHGSPNSRRKPGIRARQRHPQVSSMPEEGHQTS